jgi:hypothetical protein
VAKLPYSLLTNIFTLQRCFIEGINATTATEFMLLDRWGETQETLRELEELQNIKERLLSPYSLLLRAAESQPVAANDVLNLLYRSIESTEATLDASTVSLQEIQRDWSY